MSADPACPLCRALPGEPLGDEPIADPALAPAWSAVLVRDGEVPGLCRVVVRGHAREMTDLPPALRRRVLAGVLALEAAVREVLAPDKVNLASLGNVVPHVHWHVVPRWADDPYFPGAIWSPARREPPARALPPDLGPRLAAALARALAAGPL